MVKRSIKQMKKEVDQKHRDLHKIDTQIKNRERYIKEHYNTIGLSELRRKEDEVVRLKSEYKSVHKEMLEAEEELYGEWLPLARAGKAIGDE